MVDSMDSIVSFVVRRLARVTMPSQAGSRADDAERPGPGDPSFPPREPGARREEARRALPRHVRPLLRARCLGAEQEVGAHEEVLPDQGVHAEAQGAEL